MSLGLTGGSGSGERHHVEGKLVEACLLSEVDGSGVLGGGSYVLWVGGVRKGLGERLSD